MGGLDLCPLISAVDSGKGGSLCQDGQLQQALVALRNMDQQGRVPSAQFYRNVLQVCMKNRALAEAKWVHSHLAKNGLESDRILGDFVVTTLVNCGSLSDGLHLFRRLSHRSVFSWTAIISGHSNAGKCREALACYERMLKEGVQPSKHTFVSLLKACSRLEDLEEGKRIHAATVTHGLESDVFVGSTLISMYAKCGSLEDARDVFDGMSYRNAVSWNAMLAAYAQHGQGEKGLQIYQQMCKEGVKPDARTFVSAFQACGTLAERERKSLEAHEVEVKTLQAGKAIHYDAAHRGFESDVFVGNTLVSMYAKCGSIMNAQHVFDRLSHRDVVSRNALITAYAQQGQGQIGLQMFWNMQQEGILPDAWTFVSTIQACGTLAVREDMSLVEGDNVKLESLQMVKKIHAEAAGRGFESDVFVGTSLVSMYTNCGRLIDARHVFDGLSSRNVVSWNAMIAAYAQQEEGDMGLQIFWQMLGNNVLPDAATFLSAIEACSSCAGKEENAHINGQTFKVESLKNGLKVHAAATRMGFGSDLFVASALVSMYAKCGSIKDAEQVFVSMSHRDVVLWNAMIAAYGQRHQAGKALQLYSQMQTEGVKPDEATFLAVLEACSNAGVIDLCLYTHQRIMESQFKDSLLVTNSLIHAYSKCGSMVDAQRVFDSMPQPDVVSWNALIGGYAKLGACEMTVQCYEDMHHAGITPNRLTFIGLLSACSHGSFVDSGLEFFESMSRDYGISPTVEHYLCIIDLLGRAGLFHEAQCFLSEMPMQPDLPVWLCLLAACRKHGNVALGRQAFNCAVALKPKDAAAYVLMLQIYAHAGMLDEANEIDELRHKAGAWKKPGQSWIQLEQNVHTFLVGDRRHPEEALLYELLRELSARPKEADVTAYDSNVVHLQRRLDFEGSAKERQ